LLVEQVSRVGGYGQAIEQVISVAEGFAAALGTRVQQLRNIALNCGVMPASGALYCKA